MSDLAVIFTVACALMLAVAVATGNPIAAIVAVGCWAMAVEFREPRC